MSLKYVIYLLQDQKRKRYKGRMRTAGKVLGRCKVSLAVPDTGGNWLNPKPFSEAPGPRVVPFLGSSWRYFPFIGKSF